MQSTRREVDSWIFASGCSFFCPGILLLEFGASPNVDALTFVFTRRVKKRNYRYRIVCLAVGELELECSRLLKLLVSPLFSKSDL